MILVHCGGNETVIKTLSDEEQSAENQSSSGGGMDSVYFLVHAFHIIKLLGV